MRRFVYLAAEDVPGLAAGRRLIAEHPQIKIYREENGRGFGTLKRKIHAFDRMGASGLPVVVLTDLDDHRCPSLLIREWLGKCPEPGLVFRICVREVEAWLLADREGLARFFKIRAADLPRDPESLDDPKAALLAAMESAPEKLRAEMLPRHPYSIGPGYNYWIERFIMERWSIPNAATRARSLWKARARISELAARVTRNG